MTQVHQHTLVDNLSRPKPSLQKEHLLITNFNKNEDYNPGFQSKFEAASEEYVDKNGRAKKTEKHNSTLKTSACYLLRMNRT